MTALQTLVQVVEHLASLDHGGAAAGNRDLIAARHQRDAKTLFDPGEMPVMLAVQHRQQPIVVEFKELRRCHAGRGQAGHA